MPCLFKPDMHHTWLCIMPWLCLLVYHVVCFFPVVVLLNSSSYVAVVRIRSTTSICLLYGLVFFLAWFQARWPYPRNHFYLCLLVALSFAMPMLRYLPLALSCLPYCHVKPLTHLVLANRCLAMLPLCSAPLIALLVAGEDWSLFHVWNMYILVGISQYLLFN